MREERIIGSWFHRFRPIFPPTPDLVEFSSQCSTIGTLVHVDAYKKKYPVLLVPSILGVRSMRVYRNFPNEPDNVGSKQARIYRLFIRLFIYFFLLFNSEMVNLGCRSGTPLGHRPVYRLVRRRKVYESRHGCSASNLLCMPFATVASPKNQHTRSTFVSCAYWRGE